MATNPKNRRRVARPDPATGNVETIDATQPAETFEAPPGGSRPPPDEALDGFNTREWEDEARVAQILDDEENEGAKVEIMRKDVNARWAFCDSFPLSDWSNDRKKDLSMTFGGGEYKARVRKNTGVYGASWHFWIDRNLKPQAEAKNPAADMAQTVERLARGDGLMPMFMQMLQMQQSQASVMMQQQRESSQQMLTVITTALTRPQSPPSNDRLLEIILTKALTPAPLAPTQDLGKIIEAVAKLKDIASGEDDGRDREPKKDLLDTIITALPSVLKALSTLQQPQAQVRASATQAAALPARANPAPAPAAPAEPRNVSPQDMEDLQPPPATIEHEALTETGAAPPADPSRVPADPMRTALAEFLPVVMQLADGGTPAADVADKIAEGMDDASFDSLCTLLERPDWMALLADVNDGVMLRSNFFIALRDELLADDGGEEAS